MPLNQVLFGVTCTEREVAMDPTDPSYYTDMTKIELAELALMLHSTRLEQVSVLIAMVSGYLVTAYLVANKLTLFQLIAITLIYSLMVLITILGYIGLWSQANALSLHQSGEDRIMLYSMISATFFAGYLLSLVFMWHSRRQN